MQASFTFYSRRESLTSNMSKCNQQNNIGPLTSVRFGAALLVVLYHTSPRPPDDTWLGAFVSGILNLGFTAVGFFFVLSGFILTIVYPSLSNRRAIVRFWLARVARIYPVYILALLIDFPRLLFVRIINHGMLLGSLTTGLTLGAQITMVSAWLPIPTALNFPTWSIATEAFFYVFFPVLLLRLVHSKGRSRTLAGDITLIGLLTAVAILPPLLISCAMAPIPQWINVAISCNPILRLPEFAIGIVLAQIYRRLIGQNYQGSYLLLICGTAGWLTIVCTGKHIKYAPLEGAFLIPFFGLNILGLALCTGTFKKILSMPFALLLGEASYSLYLIHAPAWDVFLRFGGNANSAQYLFYIAASVGASILIYRLIERPSRSWLQRYSGRLAGQIAPYMGHDNSIEARRSPSFEKPALRQADS